MVKIAILKQEILRINTELGQLSPISISVVRRDLLQWYQDLPDEMRLNNLVNKGAAARGLHEIPVCISKPRKSDRAGRFKNGQGE